VKIVMFVFNDCRTDARVLREARSLVEAGHEVRIMARPSDPQATVGDSEVVNGFTIERVPIPNAWRTWYVWVRYPWRLRRVWIGRVHQALRRGPAAIPEIAALGIAFLAVLPWMAIRFPFYWALRRRHRPSGGTTTDWLVRWRFALLGWAEAAAAAAPAAGAYHGHDLTGLEAAGRAWRRNGGALVYDSHEIFLESGSNANRPSWAKAMLARSERRWVRAASALVTVNESLATELSRRLRPRRTVVVHNAPERWNAPAERPNLLRERLPIPPDASIALYHGGFSAHRGLEELAESLLEPGMERVHAVYLGYGSIRDALDELVAEPRFGGRAHVLDAVPPDELLPWVASADVGVMAIQPSTLNHRLSTPNKLFESLAAGLPVVVSDFDEMRAIVLRDAGGPLGAVCDPNDPASIARAIRSILERSPAEREALRARCLAAAHERWNWATEVGGLLALYGDLATAAGPARKPRDDHASAA
jgi:glycosyltransferase involved in cell wall biosynthesis